MLYNYYQNKNGAVAIINSKKRAEVIKVYYEIYLKVRKIDDKILRKKAYVFFLKRLYRLIFDVKKNDLRELRGVILKNAFGILRSPDIYWKEKILIILKAF